MLDKTSLSFDMNNLETMSSCYVYNDSSMAANHAHLRFEMENECTRDVYSKKNNDQFSQETIDVYRRGVYNGMLYSDTYTPLDKVTQVIT